MKVLNSALERVKRLFCAQVEPGEWAPTGMS